MEDDEINYRTLRKIQQMEKNSPILTDLRPDFYDNLSEYLESLNNRLESESSSQKQMLLKDEIQNTKKIATSIYEQREKKVLLAAVTKARGGNPDLKNMVNIEKNLFEPVLELLLNSRKKILENETIKNKSNDMKTVEPEEEKKTEEKQENSNPIVRVNQDVPEFIGTDEKKYNLKKNDMISLPEDMSGMLSKRGVVEKIKQQ
ncbi:MAG: DNA replication complex GINS family protein [Thermoplasmatales archaeon]|nr:DNA replication complex GINS family protein [Thermoplasmatales archaeon]